MKAKHIGYVIKFCHQTPQTFNVECVYLHNAMTILCFTWSCNCFTEHPNVTCTDISIRYVLDIRYISKYKYNARECYFESSGMAYYGNSDPLTHRLHQNCSIYYHKIFTYQSHQSNSHDDKQTCDVQIRDYFINVGLQSVQRKPIPVFIFAIASINVDRF